MAYSLLVNILENFLGEHRKYNEGSGQISFDCPACSDEKGLPEGDGKGNLEINYNLGLFNCWSCQDRNNMHGPIMKLLKRYATKKDIRDYLLIKPDADTIQEKDKSEFVVTLPEGYKKLSECTDKDYKSMAAKVYLYKRGITDDIIKKYDIGYTIKGLYANRIIIPSYDINGKLNYFVARWFLPSKTSIKYLNPEAEKQEIIFNEGKISFDSTIYIVEGVTDHIVVPNSIPLLGKYVSLKLLDLLHDNAMAYIVVLLDGDAYQDSINLYKILNFGNLKGRVKLIKPPKDYDPSEIHEKLGSKGIIKLLQTAFIPKDSEIY